jgi:hypothetical protein
MRKTIWGTLIPIILTYLLGKLYQKIIFMNTPNIIPRGAHRETNYQTDKYLLNIQE